jgi:hypothetical protein
MSKVKLFHSIWSKPQEESSRWDFSKECREYVELLVTATSVSFAKRNDCEIVLQTDNIGKEKYDWLPYDDVQASLQGHDYSPHFWASGKVMAQQHVPLGYIQIDTDVFIKSRAAVERLQMLGDYDLITQNIETNYEYNCNREAYKGFINMLGGATLPGLPEADFTPGHCSAYCCGTVGFNSQELKELYIEGYKKLYQQLAGNAALETLAKNHCMDLFCEQAWLYQCAKALDASVCCLLETLAASQSAVGIGYTHLAFVSKYKPEVIERVEQILQGIAPGTYRKVRELKPEKSFAG